MSSTRFSDLHLDFVFVLLSSFSFFSLPLLYFFPSVLVFVFVFSIELGLLFLSWAALLYRALVGAR